VIDPADILALDLGGFTFAVDEPLAGQPGRVIAHAIRHRDGVLLFDTGFGFGNAELDAYYRVRGRRIEAALADVGLSPDDVTEVVNSHLHVDHAGQNGTFTGVPIYVQPIEWEIAHTTGHTILDWIDVAGLDYRRVAGDHEPVEGIRVVATPGHTAGHQSIVVTTSMGVVVLAGQAVYSADEWAGQPTAREGRSRAADAAAYDDSVARLRAMTPVVVRFAHDAAAWQRRTDEPARPAILRRPC
jgi:N-acyl homoserine lactone hydrolase